MSSLTFRQAAGAGCPRRRAFTMVQILLVLVILSVLSTMTFIGVKRSRATVRRAECDVHLKEIALALEAFHKDQHRMPKNLGEIVQTGYATPVSLRCASDPDLRERGTDQSYSSYGDYYVIREPRDSGDLPVLVCPFHESDGDYGKQVYKGGYTKSHTALHATLSPSDISGAVTVTRPGVGVLALPGAGQPPLELRGGDRVRTGAGEATVRFSDGSEAKITASTEMSVLQSFVDGQDKGAIYNLVRQFSGKINYYVKPGSRFDVATPTATAGALGTRFTIEVKRYNGVMETFLQVTEHAVALSTLERTVVIVPAHNTVRAGDPRLKLLPRIPRLLNLIVSLIPGTSTPIIPSLPNVPLIPNLPILP